MGVNGLTDHVEIRVAGAVKVNTEDFGPAIRRQGDNFDG